MGREMQLGRRVAVRVEKQIPSQTYTPRPRGAKEELSKDSWVLR